MPADCLCNSEGEIAGANCPVPDIAAPDVSCPLCSELACPTDICPAFPETICQWDTGGSQDLAAELGPDIVDEEVAPLPEVVGPECPLPEQTVAPAISGLVYFDGDKTSDSFYDQGLYPAYDHPLEGMEVRLLNYESEWGAETCPDGRFSFGGLESGYYVLDVLAPDDCQCTSANYGVNFVNAVRNGEVKIVTIGDSIPTHGPGPHFPEVLGGIVSQVADTISLNKAVPGSVAGGWLPGGSYFENRLDPELADSDVVVISIGGNDVMAWMGPALYSGNYSQLLQKVMEFPEFQADLRAKVVAIVKEIQARAPHVDVVYCLYVNYAKATYWKNVAGSYYDMLMDVAVNALNKAREEMSSHKGVVLADMFGALGDENPDPYMSDSVHLSKLGHQLYGEQIFQALGGAIVAEEPLGLDRMYGFHWEEEE